MRVTVLTTVCLWCRKEISCRTIPYTGRADKVIEDVCTVCMDIIRQEKKASHLNPVVSLNAQG